MTDTANLTLESDHCPYCGIYLRYTFGLSRNYSSVDIVKDRDSGKTTIRCPSCGKEDPR